MTLLGTSLHIVFNSVSFDNRVLKETRSLANAGYKVTILGIQENDELINETLSENLRIKRYKINSRPLPKSLPFQLIKYLELCLKMITYCVSKRPSHIHCHDLATLPIGALIRFLCSSKFIYDAHEHETQQHSGPATLRTRLAEKLESTLITYCDEVITVSEGIADDYALRYKIKKPTLIFNCPPTESVTKGTHLRDAFNIPKDTTLFIYQGALNPGRNIPLILDTFKNHLSSQQAIVFLGFGSFEKEIQDVAKTTPNIHFHTAVPGNQLIPYTASADCGLVLTEDISLSFKYSMPNKLFEYLMAEIPCIVSPLMDQSEYIKNQHVGIICDPVTPTSLANVILNFKNTYQNNIKKTKQIYCWETQEKRLLELYR